MEKHETPERHVVDVLFELLSDPGRQKAIDTKITHLNEGGGDEKLAESEAWAVGEVAELLGGDNLHNQSTNVIGLGWSESHKALDLIAVSGRYDTVARFLDEKSQLSQVALRIVANEGEAYYFPLKKDSLVCFDVEMECYGGECCDRAQIRKAIDEMHSQVEASRQIVQDAHFYQLDLDDQIEALSTPAVAIQDNLAVLFELYGDMQVEWSVVRYRQIQRDMLHILGWDSELMKEYQAEDNEPLAVVADTIDVYNPDIDSDGRQLPFESPKEFIFSGGEPMVVLENRDLKMLYVVRVSDIIHFRPVPDSNKGLYNIR